MREHLSDDGCTQTRKWCRTRQQNIECVACDLNIRQCARQCIDALNETALFAINKFMEGLDPEATAREFSEEFEVEEELALSAVEVFIRQLGRYLK